MYFDELDLNDNVLDALYDMRFETCTPVQEQCIPEILKGNDLLGVAQTGTGKTAAYLLPILSKLDDGGYPKDAINCVIMSPTRELAQQIDQAMQGFGYYLNDVSSVAIYGGNDGNRYDQELKSLSLGADVVIATPGRLISHISMGNADFSRVSFFVLDEADRMLDMGFSEDIKKIAQLLPPTCQTIMFSATMPDKIEELAKTLLKNPVVVKLAVSKPAEKIKQTAYVCYETQKLGIIQDIFKQGDLKRVIIFSGKKQKVKAINRALMRMHVNSGEMHSDLDQAERDQMLYKFKSGQIDVLVATDILARGIDIDDIAMVINFDVPHDAEDYVHRIGRTARADRDGVAITFINEEDVHFFKQIEKLLEKEVEKLPLPEELGEGPEYKEGRAQRTSAKSRRRKDRDATSHKRKPRRTENERKEKQPKDKQHQDKQNAEKQTAEAAEGSNTKTAPVAAEDHPTDNAQQQEQRKPRRRRGNNKPRQSEANRQNQPTGDADNASNNASVNADNASESSDNASENRSRRNGNKARQGKGKQNNVKEGDKQESNAQQGKAQQGNKTGKGNDKQGDKQPAKQGKQANGQQAKQGDKQPAKQGKQANGQQAKQGDKQPAKQGKQANGQQAKQGDKQPAKKRSRKPCQQRSEQESQPVSTKYAKSAGMSPVVNPSQDSVLKSLLKKPLKWLKKLGK
ncbi:MAG: DEAD/DEAH box helicase [Prevotella sp.]|nr:DEAD/DEAH box helicase [Prevotella sp.]